MNKIRSILAASDFSVSATRAAKRAALLAGEHSAGLQLLHVVPEDALSQLREHFRTAVYLQQHLLDDAKRRLEVLAKEVRPDAKSHPECHARAGNVLDTILDAADHADLLVLGAHGSRSLRDLPLGTTAERLLQKCRRPLLVAREEVRSSYRRVLVPVDFSMYSFGALLFALQIAPTADFLIFHAYDCPYESELRQAAVSELTIEQFHIEYRNQALSNIEAFRDKAAAPVERTKYSVECSDAKIRVAAKAADESVDLIVLGKHGRSFIGDLFVGGVTRHTVFKAPCDVLIVPEWPRT